MYNKNDADLVKKRNEKETNIILFAADIKTKTS